MTIRSPFSACSTNKAKLSADLVIVSRAGDGDGKFAFPVIRVMALRTNRMKAEAFNRENPYETRAINFNMVLFPLFYFWFLFCVSVSTRWLRTGQGRSRLYAN